MRGLSSFSLPFFLSPCTSFSLLSLLVRLHRTCPLHLFPSPLPGPPRRPASPPSFLIPHRPSASVFRSNRYPFPPPNPSAFANIWRALTSNGLIRRQPNNQLFLFAGIEACHRPDARQARNVGMRIGGAGGTGGPRRCHRRASGENRSVNFLRSSTASLLPRLRGRAVVADLGEHLSPFF